MNTADALKRFRNVFGIQQQKIADALGMARQNYAKYENDGIKPSAEVIREIAVTFGISADYLLGISDIPRKLNDDTNDDLVLDKKTLQGNLIASTHKTVRVTLEDLNALIALATATQNCHKSFVDAIVKSLPEQNTKS